MSEKGSGVEAVLKSLSAEQRENVLKLTASKTRERSGLATSLNNNEKEQQLPGSVSDSSDDVIVIDDSDEEDGEDEVELMDISSEISTGSGISEQANKPGGEIEIVENPPEENHENDKILPSPPAGGLSESEEEASESEYEWEVITIDDDEDELKPRPTPALLKCFRCPNPRNGTFTNEKKYWVHVERHIQPSSFVCPKCDRTFTKLSYCLSHEIRVHEVPLAIDLRDSAITLAKLYVKNRSERREKRNHDQAQQDETEEETDCEDVKFYDNRFVPSTTLYPYRGIPTVTMLDAYEAQYAASRPKSSRANNVAKIAIDIHVDNVKKGQDIYKLGKFLKRKLVKGTIKQPRQIFSRPNPSESLPPPPVTSRKRDRDAALENDADEKPKKKMKVREPVWMTSSSSSSEADSDYSPEEKPEKNKGHRKVQPGPSGSQYQKSARKREDVQSKGSNNAKKCFSALMKRVCMLCDHVWETENDLREHRDLKHPNVPLVDLMSFPVKKKAIKKSSKPKAASKSTKKTEPKVVTAAKKKDPKKVAAKKTKKQLTPSAGANQKKKPMRQGRSQVTRKSHVPLPDSSFTRKEKFLHGFELTNCVRLHLHQKKPIKDLNLRECSVRVYRMSESDIDMYRNGGVSSLPDIFPQHFLLG